MTYRSFQNTTWGLTKNTFRNLRIYFIVSPLIIFIHFFSTANYNTDCQTIRTHSVMDTVISFMLYGFFVEFIPTITCFILLYSRLNKVIQKPKKKIHF